MKRPYLNEWQRKLVYWDTTQGAFIMLGFAVMKLRRAIQKEAIDPLIKKFGMGKIKFGKL